jgi:hypothetical protein
MRVNSLAAGLALIFTAACTDGANPPTAPDVAGPITESAAAATIAGSLMTPEGARLAGIGVSVVGATQRAESDAGGQFTLKVPAGDIQLQFTGTSVNAQLPVTDIKKDEIVSLAVSVSGTSARLVSRVHPTPPPPDSEFREIEGRIDLLPLSPAGSFGIDGQIIQTNSQTVIRRGDATAAFADLEIGMRVHVKAVITGDVIVASIVMIQNTNSDLPVPQNGIVSEFSGTAAAFQFEIDDVLIKGDADTEFFGNSEFADLKNGARAEVKGTQKNGFVYADRIHVNGSGDDDDDDADSDLTPGPGGPPKDPNPGNGRGRGRP